MATVHCNEIFSLVRVLKKEYQSLGFEFHPFKIGWYNRCVSPIFHVNCDDDTIAMLVISNPSMFEKAFVPYLRENYDSNLMHDPIDECMIFYLSKIEQVFPQFRVEVIHDFDMHPNRRPRALMQTAAHVSGAAYLYQRSHLVDDTFGSKKVYGVCIHPKYGGWFALRGIIIFHNILCPELAQKEPQDVVEVEKRNQLLEMYNYSWKDWKFRDIIPVTQKYSPLAMRYFSMLPKDRFSLIHEIISSHYCESNS